MGLPEATTAQTERLSAAFATWQQAQRDAIDAMLASSSPATTADRAEGFRWVTRIASLAQEWFMEKAVDPRHPVLFESQDAYRKLMVDNPDVTYHFSVLDESRRYRLWGNRGEASYVGLAFGTPIFAGASGSAGGRLGTLLQVNLDDLTLDPDGGFEAIIARERPEGATNWIEMVPGTGQVAIRETFHDRATQRPASLHLELVEPEPAAPLDPDWFAERMELAALFVAFVTAMCHEMWAAPADHVNTLSGQSGQAHHDEQSDEVRSHTDTDMVYHGGRFRLADGEALEITVQPPPAAFVYWGITICNPWMESYDYRWTQVNLNDRSARRNDDGTWTLFVAADDPGHPNWLHTDGRPEGYLLIRWCLAPGATAPACRVVTLEGTRQTPLR